MTAKYSFENYKNEVKKYTYCNTARTLSFKTEELRDKFLENFKELIEIAKPLI